MLATHSDTEPCPWCEDGGIPRVWWNRRIAFVECEECGCQGPAALTEEDALELWNRRNTTHKNTRD